MKNQKNKKIARRKSNKVICEIFGEIKSPKIARKPMAFWFRNCWKWKDRKMDSRYKNRNVPQVELPETPANLV